MPFHDAILVWFRRDLRAEDHAALHRALGDGRRVHCVFVFDREILDRLPSRYDRRVAFIRESLVALDAELGRVGRAAGGAGGGLIVRHGLPADEIPRLAVELGVGAVYANRDYEPAAKARDRAVAAALQNRGGAFRDFKDQAVFDGDEVLTQAGRPFTVFTPYRRAWRRRLDDEGVPAWTVADRAAGLQPGDGGVPGLDAIGFGEADLAAVGLVAGEAGAAARWREFAPRLGAYGETRDFPVLAGTSGLSVHLRFGTVSIRRLAAHALAIGGEGAEAWLGELCWRDFYFAILDRFPHVVDGAFRREFDALAWDDRDDLFAAWTAGRTGYPLVDAAMRELAATGRMHNRLRMVTASFLVKDLGIDWRRGERHFAGLLNDFDLAANNGGWQWSASTGCDGQPWFRIFNPVTQSQKFDPDGAYLRHWLPELAACPPRLVHAPWVRADLVRAACGCVVGRDYPAPVVDHAAARLRTLERYGRIGGSGR